MQWALDHWDEAGPGLVALLERCAAGLDRTEETKRALFFVLHLVGERRETSAFPTLCRLLAEREVSEEILGDAISEHLRDILISTFNGDTQPLRSVVESTDVDEFARGAALEAMAYLAGTGAFAEGEMRDYLLHLYSNLQPQNECYVWVTWIVAAANLGYHDLADRAEHLIERGFTPHRAIDMRDFGKLLQLTLDDPERMAGFEYDRVAPFDDAIGSLSGWYYFSEQYKEDEARRAERSEDDDAVDAALLRYGSGEPYVNVLRHVGRNDPCPCGSGKKYKRCCLA
jgi:hypothetical protein